MPRSIEVIVRASMLVTTLFSIGCQSAGETADTSEAVLEVFCAEAPVVNYANFGESFMNHQCQGCHSSALEERFDAPLEVTFDTLEDVWVWRDRILDRCDLDAPTMPPRGGVTDDELLMLHWWLKCATIGT
jgi:cytochrome c5